MNESIVNPEQHARQLHRSGCNCCQAVVLAFADRLPLSPDVLRDLSAPFGRGLSGLREVCGCVSAMAMVAGLTGHAADVKALADRFRAENGDVNCGRLLMSGKRPCNDMVASAARLLNETIH